MTDYDTEQWAAETVEGRRVFNAGFAMLSGDLAGWELVKAIPFETSRGAGEFVYMWRRGELELLRIWVAEQPDWRSAQARLLEDLHQSMRSDIPRATGKLASLGDVSYVSRSAESDLPSSISFARGNVCASVRSVGDRDVDASEAALWLDDALARPPGRGGPGARERVGKRRLENLRSQGAGQEALVVERVIEAAHDAWLQAVADKGELARRDDTLVHVATEPGAVRVALYTYRARPSRGRTPRRPTRAEQA